MKLLIAGSRSITDFDISPYIPAEQYADKNRISKLILRPRYDLYRRAAPLKRNDEMVQLCDKVLIFWDGVSKGTKHTIDYANKIGKPIEIITVSES